MHKTKIRRVEKLVETTKEGGKVLLGGKRAANFNKGYYMNQPFLIISKITLQ